MTAVVITAGGIGSRFGLTESLPKQFIKLEGERVLTKTINVFKEFASLLIVTIPSEFEEFFKIEYPNIEYVIGGSARQASIYNALCALKTNEGNLLVTDAVRPFTSKKLIQSVIKELEQGEKAVIPVLKCTDTIKQFKNGYVVNTLNREELCAVQTPQGFNLKLLKELHEKYKNSNFSDDSLLFEQEGIAVKIIEGEKSNFKITTKEDII